MNTDIDAGTPRPRLISQGRAFVYVLPCAEEDILKIGFSRDPVERMQALHRRYFDFFDLQRGLLVETDSVRDARVIERRLIDSVRGHRAPAPLVVPLAAAGHTEWFRGAMSEVSAVASEIARGEGYGLHAPLEDWLREALRERSGLIFEWSSNLFSHLECMTEAADRLVMIDALRNALDAYTNLGIALRELVCDDVHAWYVEQRDRRA